MCIRDSGYRVDQEEIRPLAADDKTLLAVEQEIVPFIFRPASGAEEVGTASRLGEAFGGKKLALQQRPHIFFFLLVGAVQNDRVADQSVSYTHLKCLPGIYFNKAVFGLSNKIHDPIFETCLLLHLG